MLPLMYRDSQSLKLFLLADAALALGLLLLRRAR
jgi:hypothetical protein